MGFFESLKQQFPEVVAHNSKIPAAKKEKHPRSEVLELIDHSIRYLDNPNFRVKDRHNNEVVPLLCYEFTGEGAKVSLTFRSVRLVIEDENDEFEIYESHLRPALDLLRKHVEDRHLDDQIERIHAKRA